MSDLRDLHRSIGFAASSVCWQSGRFREVCKFALTLYSILIIPVTEVESEEAKLEVGLHYYAISNLSNPAIPVLRGKAGSQGYAHDLVILALNIVNRLS